MKSLKYLSIALLLSMFVGVGYVGTSNVAYAFTDVIPTLVSNWQSGNAEFECQQAGDCGDFAYKVDGWNSETGMDGNYIHAGNTITISSSDGQTFSWSSIYPVCAVIVKGGPSANIFHYSGSFSDTQLYAPVNPNNGKNYDISHVTFCFSEPNLCYEDETAWTAGNRYVNRGNWATYTSYEGVAKSVNIFAGQNYLAGTAAFSAPSGGNVTITINLNPGFIFYYDPLNTEADNNIKVQDYASAPSGNPAPGLFGWKFNAPVGSQSYVIVVPANNFYGIHLDVARQVPCP